MCNYQLLFEKLEVWQLARILASDIYKTTRNFPSEEEFSLVSQIRRAAVSVAANIAEGAGRISAKEQARFTTMAYSSLMELYNHLIIASDLGYIEQAIISEYKGKIQVLSIKLSNYKKSQLKRLWLSIIHYNLHLPSTTFNNVQLSFHTFLNFEEYASVIRPLRMRVAISRMPSGTFLVMENPSSSLILSQLTR